LQSKTPKELREKAEVHIMEFCDAERTELLPTASILKKPHDVSWNASCIGTGNSKSSYTAKRGGAVNVENPVVNQKGLRFRRRFP